jgi:hypothetical protein
MKKGDMVRFRAPHPKFVDSSPTRPWLIGLLIEYHKWEKIATIMYNDELIRIAARDTQKYGRRYLEIPRGG